MINALVTGADGQLGRALLRAVPPRVRVRGLSRRELDVTSGTAVERAVADWRPDWVINAAAYTAVDAAEADPETAYAINSDGVANVARAATTNAARLLHVSTDFVFDGRAPVPYAADAVAAPLGVYGASKAAGELRAREFAPSSVVVRTSWLYGRDRRNFVLTMLDLMRTRPGLRVVDDQIGSPTWVSGLADTLWELVAGRAPAGTYHWRDAGIASWYDFAVAIGEEAFARRLIPAIIPIEAIRSMDFAAAARRPSYSVLDVASTVAVLGRRPIYWREQLRKMLDELATQ